jgi:hypothetical protein
MEKNQYKSSFETENNNTIYIIGIFTMTFAIIAKNWRKRKWT